MGIPPIGSRRLRCRGFASCLTRAGSSTGVAVDDVLKRGELAEIQALIKGARDVKAKYGDIDGLISQLEAAAKKAQDNGRPAGRRTARPLRGARRHRQPRPGERGLGDHARLRPCLQPLRLPRRPPPARRAQHRRGARPRRPDRRARRTRCRPDRRRGLSEEGLARDRRRDPRRRDALRPADRRPQPQRGARRPRRRRRTVRRRNLDRRPRRDPRQAAGRARLVRARARGAAPSPRARPLRRRQQPDQRLYAAATARADGRDHRGRRDQLAARHHHRHGQCRRSPRACCCSPGRCWR